MPNPSGIIVLLASVTLAAHCLAEAPLSSSGPPPNYRLGGLLFGDFYHIASHHTGTGKGAAGVVIRRGYLTFSADLTDKWFTRARLELNQSGGFETYRFDVEVKDLYIGRKFKRHRLILGLSPTPTFDLIDSIWGLRYLARSPMDMQGIPSRDTGIAAKGPLNSSGSLGYRAMVVAPLGFGNETGEGPASMGAITWKPAPRWTLDFYGDYERIDGPFDRTTGQIFAGYKSATFRWGAQYSLQDRQQSSELELASTFAVYNLSKRTSLIGRVDRIMEPSPHGNNISYIPFDPSARATFFLGGVEFRPKDYFTVIPNVITIAYDVNKEGVRPNTDIHLRLTVYFNFE